STTTSPAVATPMTPTTVSATARKTATNLSMQPSFLRTFARVSRRRRLTSASGGADRQQRPNELSGRGCGPVVRAHQTPDQLSLPVDEVGGRRSPDPVKLPRDLPGLVEEHGSDVAALGRRASHEGRVFPEADQQDLEPLRLEVLIEPVDGR